MTPRDEVCKSACYLLCTYWRYLLIIQRGDVRKATIYYKVSFSTLFRVNCEKIVNITKFPADHVWVGIPRWARRYWALVRTNYLH